MVASILPAPPPVSFALKTPIDMMLAGVAATNATYTESGLTLMMPVEPSRLDTLKNRGAKVMVYHGVSDPIFSVNDPDVPATWSASRSRPLCPYPQVARLKSGATGLGSKSSFRCE